LRVVARSCHCGLKGMQESRTWGADDRYGSKEARRQREVGGRSTETVRIAAHRCAHVVASDRAGDQQRPRLMRGRHEAPILRRSLDGEQLRVWPGQLTLDRGDEPAYRCGIGEQ